ncbi:MAG: DUF4469 domain-containing protein [Spirochaetaceae bacterium]|jgi:hypothetical protein|nr:DUF4469 domain-containing protein [Spirochaetaceae bacterium]
MALDFTLKDIIHKITVKFSPAFLPDAKKPYNLKAVHQPDLDIHAVASKAEVYNIEISPKVIEEGLTAGLELMYYLAADGYKIKTPLFNLRIRVPGEYDGAETRLPEGVFPEARLQVSAAFRSYIRDKVKLEFDGIDQREGIIGEAVDEATGLADEVLTIGGLVTIHGSGLKVESDAAHKADAGLYFEDSAGARVKAAILAVNEPRTLKAITPAALTAGTAYRLLVITQGTVKHSGTLLKDLREVRSEFALTAQTGS